MLYIGSLNNIVCITLCSLWKIGSPGFNECKTNLKIIVFHNYCEALDIPRVLENQDDLE